MIKINKGKQDLPLKHKGADKMKDFLLTQVMTPRQVKYSMDKSHCVIGHTAKDGEHVTVARQWRNLVSDFVTVGRSPKTDITLVHPQSDGKLNDKGISRFQFLLEWLTDDEVRITDLNSTNGTFVNGERIKRNSSYLLKDGDEILVGETRLLFERGE